ncbi:DUF4174 domain-containing protein [Zunongwangia endophytica]|uniref:DUF4174 domain-containing protein n=1 Tax=Zunongwangia endophytica TaxID=1808945 RepID=A0ABV8H7N1_9FLAO|nr:DUF4174 domain-containing protein [Zunongwangia endophytica]MDN3595720.1 DUF4174 domain-containing protein [Zunongwangia endophytica]
MKKVLIVILSFMALGNMNAQDKSEHQWENRLVLILTDSKEDNDFKQQLGEFKDKDKDLEDRKIVVYQVTPKQYATGISDNPDWKEGDNFYEKFKKSEKSFEIILIGLDGGTKMRKEEFTPAEEIFEKIDIMPMRKAELN